MIRRNVAGQVIYLPQLTTVDGVAITSAASITVAKDGVEASSAGTLTHFSNGVWKYAPTAGETDAAIVGLVLTATGGLPVVLNLITTAANTAAVAFGANTTTPPTAAAIADAVWDEAYNQHTTAGTFGKLMDILRKSNTVIEGTILASPTPTTTTFKISGADYPTGALEHSVLWLNSGNASEQNSPILTTTNNGDGTLTIVLEEALTVAPTAGDTVLIDPTSHVHTIAEIVSGVWSALTNGLSVVGSTGRALARLIGLVQDNGGDEFTTKALNRAPSSAGGGDASQATLLLVKAKTDLITSQTANQQQTPVNQMVIIRGDSYSGATRKTHAVTTDYTGYTATFTIRHRVTDAVLLSVAGAVDSSTQLSVTLTTANTAFALLVDPTEFGPHPYDFRLVSGAVEKTESGIAIIRRDVTRA